MQMLVTSCKKMKVYHVDDSQDWDLVLDKYREAILNEKYVLSEDIQELIGKGAVLSFRKAVIERKTSFKEDAINFIEVPENDEFNLILKTVSEIYINIHEHKDNDFLILADCPVDNLTGDLTKIHVSHMEGSDETVVEGREKNQDSMDKDSSAFSVKEDENKTAVAQHTETKEEGQVAEESKSMQVLFGNNDQNGSAIIWSPNDTTQLFHTNTGIIGTMGTGKTQFTKSLITQMYREQGKNVEGKPVGILIFDYKGDYNETKTDFVEVTNATIYKPYHLPFNPLALTKSSVFKPLLPMHTANAFKDTLSKAFNLGPKQQNTLLQCILETYRASGIMPANPDTWDEPAPTLYEIELQKRKIDVLAETITNCYTKLANKKNLIKTIVMDPETLDLKYLSEEGIEIPKDSLSAGEQQLMVISILWALAICSKKKLPVIIDTPLSRLDSLHRTALITTYFPNAGEQTIILSTDSEIDENYYELMRENVGDEFTLKYDEDSKSTSIERGYLIGAKL